ncbi:MAG: glycosyltransferase [Eubacterium sp.]|nr:glycosyltransferase [Eubacterium sp.]
MKLLTVAIPCYNSEGYMSHAIETALAGGEDVEIIIVDDGSTDGTKQIADKYALDYPNIIRVIHQQNKGHGGAVNTGLKNATGKYFKVLDSDDWFDEDSFLTALGVIRNITYAGKKVDMLITNYVYEKVYLNKRKVIRYTNVLPINTVFRWDDVGRFAVSQNILMHSVIYRTQLLKESGLELPEHTFYVDNLFVYDPLPFVKTMFYLNVDMYRYYIGREDQSVNEAVMIKNIDQQIAVNKLMIDSRDLTTLESKGLKRYMAKYLAMILIVSSSLLLRDGTEESIKKRDELWDYLKTKNPGMYDMINKGFLNKSMQYSSWLGKKIVVGGYAIARKFYGFS